MTPWNFPHTLNVMKLGAALAAGNTLVLKPSPLTPIAGLALARIIHEETDIPPGSSMWSRRPAWRPARC